MVGGGPNGLAAAIALAAEGVSVTVLEAADEVGGGARSSEAIIPGLLHDHCSAIHPMADRLAVLQPLRPAAVRTVVALAGDRLCPPARRRQCRRAAPLGGADRGRSRSRRIAVAARVRLPGRPVRRTQRGHHAAPAAVPAPSADAGPVRCTHRASRVHVRPAVPHRRGARLVRRRCGPCLPAAALPDDLRDRDGHHRGRPPARLGGGRRRIAVDHQRDGGAAGRLGRQDRDRCPGPDGVAAAAGGRHDVRSGAERRRRDPRGPSSAPSFARLHQVPARSGCIQSRLRRRRRRALDEPGRPPGRHGAPGRDLRRTCRNRAGYPRGTHARAAVRVWSVSSIWPIRNARWATFTRCGATRTSRTAIPATRPRRSSLRSSGSRPVSGNASSGQPFARRRRSPPTTPTMSAATS